jgi:hypothetical protein
MAVFFGSGWSHGAMDPPLFVTAYGQLPVHAEIGLAAV